MDYIAFWDNVLVVSPGYNELAWHRMEPICEWIATFSAFHTGFHFLAERQSAPIPDREVHVDDRLRGEFIKSIRNTARSGIGCRDLFGFCVYTVWKASGIKRLEHYGLVIPTLVKSSARMNPKRENRTVTVYKFNVARRLSYIHSQSALTVAAAIGFIVITHEAGIIRKLFEPINRWATINRRIRN